jgi:hypothetical protein
MLMDRAAFGLGEGNNVWILSSCLLLFFYPFKQRSRRSLALPTVDGLAFRGGMNGVFPPYMFWVNLASLGA